MNSATIIYPHQLFHHHPRIEKNDYFFVFEEQLFFKYYQYPHFFHKKKLILHRASMKQLHHYLSKKNKCSSYIDYELGKEMKNLHDACQDKRIDIINVCELNDYTIHKRLQEFVWSTNIISFFLFHIAHSMKYPKRQLGNNFLINTSAWFSPISNQRDPCN